MMDSDVIVDQTNNAIVRNTLFVFFQLLYTQAHSTLSLSQKKMPCPCESRNAASSTPTLRPLPSRRVIPGLPSPSASLALRTIEKIERKQKMQKDSPPVQASSSVDEGEGEEVEILPALLPLPSKKRRIRMLAGSLASEDRKRRWRARGLGVM